MIRFASRGCVSVFLAAALFTIAGIAAWAQSTGGRINGRVTDPSGAVVPDVAVAITNDANGARAHTQTSKTGDYSFPSVAVGTYTVDFEATGFKKLTRKQVALGLNETLTVNGTLELGSKTETVEVTSEAPSNWSNPAHTNLPPRKQTRSPVTVMSMASLHFPPDRLATSCAS